MSADTAAGAPTPRKLLLVSGSLGGGHHAAARAVEEQARCAWPGVEVAWVETLERMGPGTGRLFRAVYAGCIRRLPWLYELYFLLLWRVPPFRAGTRAVLGAWSARGLRPAIDRHAPDVVVATFPEAVQGLGRLRRRGLLPMAAVALVADPAPHPLWVDPALDLHLVSTPEAAALVDRIAPAAPVRVGALPVVSAFRPPDEPRCPRPRPLVYVSCGSFAFGDVPAACGAVLSGGGDVLVGSGHDAELRRRLEPLADAHPGRVEIHDWIDDPVTATRGCDAVVTNAGGATALEAIACARPLLLFDPIPGHGRANAAVLAEAGAARICRGPAELTAAVAGPLCRPITPNRDGTSDMAAIARLGRANVGPRVRPHDGLFLHLAGPPQQVGACIVVDDPARRDGWPEYLADLTRQRAAGIDLLHRRLAPPRPGRPLRWLVDPSPDPARHISPTVVDVPDGQGFDAAMTAFLADPVDPMDAPWALQVARDGDRVAVMAKVHHALGDGMAVTESLVNLLVDERSDVRAQPATASLPNRFRQALGALRGVASLAGAGFAGRSILGPPVGDVRWVGVTLDGRRVRAAARHHGVGTSVLVLAAVAEALHAVRPEARHRRLRVMVPVTTRSRADVASRAAGNRTAAVPLDLPVGPMSPPERVELVATAMDRAVRAGRPAGSSCALAALGLPPTAVQRVLARRVYGPPFFHAIASVLPGVRRPLHIRRAPLMTVLPALPLTAGVGLGVGAMHWRDTTTIGITTSIPGLAEVLPPALEEAMVALAGSPAEAHR